MIQSSKKKANKSRIELNQFADQWFPDQELPTTISWSDVTHTCETIFDQVGERIDTFVTDTPLTQQEAEVWVLRNVLDPQYNRLTFEGIALAMAAPDSPFGTDQETSEEPDTPTRSTVVDWYRSADSQYAQARDFVGATTYYNCEESIDSPQIALLSWATTDRLQSQAQSGDSNLDDVVTRLLAETESRLTLEEFSQAYLTARGEDSIATIVLHKQTSGSTLWFVSYGDVMGELPDVIRDTDAIEIDGERYEFYFDEDPYWPADRGGLVTLYATDGMDDVEPVPLDRGIDAVRERVMEAATQGGFDSQAGR